MIILNGSERKNHNRETALIDEAPGINFQAIHQGDTLPTLNIDKNKNKVATVKLIMQILWNSVSWCGKYSVCSLLR